MADNNREPQLVEVVGHPQIGEPSAPLCFAFANLSFLFWGNLLGIFGPDAGLLAGCCQLGVFVCYHLCAQDLYKNGDAWNGSIFMIFASMFGGVGGLTNVATAIAGYAGVPVSPTLTGVIWFICGFLLLVLLPAVRKDPAATFLFYLAGGLGLALQGLAQLDVIPTDPCYTIAAWCFFCAGVLGILVCVSTFYSFRNVNIPLGRPLFK